MRTKSNRQATRGEFLLVEDTGETVLRPGDSGGRPAGVPDGHHLQNRTEADATFLVVGTRNDNDHGEYSDIDMAFADRKDPSDVGGQTSRTLPFAELGH
ncbi:MAG: hypothetical protein WBN10_00915 [Polyangiales bacterium]